MRVPGFSAGAAVYKTDGHYHVSGAPAGELTRHGLVESALSMSDLSESLSCARRCGESEACLCHCLGGVYNPPRFGHPGICILF